MNRIEKSFFVDLLSILPENIDCFIQAPSLENTVIEKMLQDSEYGYYKLLQLNSANRDTFVNQEEETLFSVYIQNIQIRKEGVLLFEGFDGVEYGTISNKVQVPDYFKVKYIPDTCMISSEW